MITFDVETGRPDDVASSLRRRVSALTRRDRVRAFKIGITAAPERRFCESYAQSYDQMVVLYRTQSYASICRIEQDLIDHNWEVCDNLVRGGGGRICLGPYFLYVVREH
ncbi:MAG TPA: hypothetical protein VFT45_01960 [Longimicrobium sp.]|nr:hypothetical protein [Longimicrobium sp.]